MDKIETFEELVEAISKMYKNNETIRTYNDTRVHFYSPLFELSIDYVERLDGHRYFVDITNRSLLTSMISRKWTCLANDVKDPNKILDIIKSFKACEESE